MIKWSIFYKSKILSSVKPNGDNSGISLEKGGDIKVVSWLEWK